MPKISSHDEAGIYSNINDEVKKQQRLGTSCYFLYFLYIVFFFICFIHVIYLLKYNSANISKNKMNSDEIYKW